MTKAFSYVRFSTPEQAKGDSLRRQLEDARAWAAQRGLELDETLRDLGVSAYRGTNYDVGALKTFLRLVESGQVPRGSYLIVESLDRLSREAVLDALARLIDLVQAGITVVTLADGLEYSEGKLRADWSPLLMSLTIMARAHEESRLKGQRVGGAWRRKREDARNGGRPLTRRCPEWMRLVDGRFELISDRVEVVQRIYRMAIEGYGRRTILRMLNADGIPAFRGRSGWQSSSLNRILTSRTVLGEYQPYVGTHRAGNRQPEGDPIPDYYPAIIDHDTYWQAQNASKGRRLAAGRRGSTVAHLFHGLARCGVCSSPMYIQNKGKGPRGGIYLACSSAIRRTGCTNSRHWRVDHLEHLLLNGISFVDATAFQSLDGNSTPPVDPVAVLSARLEDLEARRDRLLVVIESGDERVKERFLELANEIKAVKVDLQRARADVARATADPGLRSRLADAVDLTTRMKDAEPDERKAIRIRLAEVLRGLVDRIVCDPGQGAFAVLKPRLGVLHMDGRVPVALRIEGTADGSTQVSMLIEATDEVTAARFIGMEVE